LPFLDGLESWAAGHGFDGISSNGRWKTRDCAALRSATP
jgi:hypothetical protein